MTLHEFTKPLLLDMGNVTLLTNFLVDERKDKEIDRMMDYLSGEYDNKIHKTNKLRKISKTIAIIIDIIVEIGLIGLVFIGNNKHLSITFSIIAIIWAISNFKIYHYFSGDVKKHFSNTFDKYKDKQYHESIKSSKETLNVPISKFNSFLYNLYIFKLNVCSFGKYYKFLTSIDDDVNSYMSNMVTYTISYNTFAEMLNNIHSVVREKYNASEEIFDDNNIDKLNEYIDKKFNSSFIKSVYKNITPSNENRNNILFILLMVIFTIGYKLSFVKDDDGNLIFDSNLEYPKNRIQMAIQLIELKIFQYGFSELKNVLMVTGDEELINSINSLVSMSND